MRRKNSCLVVTLCVGFLFLVNAVYGEGRKPLTIDTVFHSVSVHHPTVKINRIDLEMSRAALLSSEGAFDPVLQGKWNATNSYYDANYFDAAVTQLTGVWGATVVAGYRKGQGDFPVYDGAYKTNSGGEFRTGVDIPLLKNGSTDTRRTEIEKNRLGVIAAQQQYEYGLQEQLRLASVAYWDWVSEGLKLAIVGELLQLAEERDAGLKVRLKYGDISAFEQKDNLRAVLQRRGQKLLATRNLKRASLFLSLFLRDESGNPIVPEESEIPTLDELDAMVAKTVTPKGEDPVAEALRLRKDVARLREIRKQYQFDYWLSKNQILPKLDFSLYASQDLGGPSNALNQTEYKAGLGFEMPLFLRNGRGKEQYYRVMVEKIDVQLQFLMDRVAVDVKNTIFALNNVIERVGIAAEEAKLSRQLADSEFSRFRHGDSNILFVNIREQAYLDAIVRSIEAKIEAQKLYYELRFHQGGLVISAQ